MLRLFARRGGTDGVGAGRFAVGKEVFRCMVRACKSYTNAGAGACLLVLNFPRFQRFPLYLALNPHRPARPAGDFARINISQARISPRVRQLQRRLTERNTILFYN